MQAEGILISVSSFLRPETLFEIKVSFLDIVVEGEWILPEFATLYIFILVHYGWG